MKIEKKDSKITKSKITMLYPPEVETKDPAVDRLLKDSLIQEADALEASIDGDPRLAGLEAPDGLFDKIVAQLKKEGKWEEELPKQTEARMQEKIREQEGDPGVEKGCERIKASDRKTSGERTEIAEIEKSYEYEKASDIEKSLEGREASEREKGREYGETSGIERSREYKEASDIEKKRSQIEPMDTETKQEQVYAMLSEEDKKALEIGRSVLRKEHRRKKKAGRWQRAVKRSGIAAAAFVAVFGLAMTSEANRKAARQIWESAIERFGFWTMTNYTSDGDVLRQRTSEEEQALQDIMEKTGIPAIELAYLPYGMEFLDCTIRAGEEAEICYTSNGKIMRVLMMYATDSVYYYAIDQDTSLKETINTFQNQQAKIWVTTGENGEESYMAEIGYANCKYLINAVVSLEEMEKIVENIFFFDTV